MMALSIAPGFKRYCVIAFLAAALAGPWGCSSGDDAAVSGISNVVPPMIFGVNLAWEHLGDGAMDGGDMVWDRSFRAKADTTIVDRWGEIKPVGNTITWNTTDPGDVNASGGKYYTGYVEFSSASPGYTGIVQQLMSGVSKDVTYEVNFSSFGSGGAPDIDLFLYADLDPISLIGSASVKATSGIWTQHAVTITPSSDAAVCYLGIYLRDTGTVRIDEVRLARKGAEPSVKDAYKTRIQDLGITTLRWPGGTLADMFSWKESIGTRLSRGEVRAYDRLETPALGLHEFLNLCEELDVEPLVTINIFSAASEAAELVEYVLGSSATVQGAIRAANGRTAPWNVKYFEIGNEPAESYKGSGATENAGANYAVLAKAIIPAMKARASALGKTICVSGISEPNFQLAPWVVPSSPSEIVKLIYNWNNQVFDPSTGIAGDIDFVHGHYYMYRDYDADEAARFRNLMSGGTVLARTLPEKITPLTGDLPFWVTEYQVLLEIKGVPQASYTYDFQSGLSVADLVMSMITGGVDGAFIWNLSQNGAFGITGTSGSWGLKPAGHVFQLLSAAAGEEILEAEVLDAGTYTVSPGVGNIPSGQTYPLVSVLATRNASTGKPRIFALNRDYAASHAVSVTVEGLAAGSATRYRYENSSLSANNESDPLSVTVIQETITVGSPIDIMLEPHSFTRIDVE